MYYGIAIADYTAMVLTAYDASSAEEGDRGVFLVGAPTAAPYPNPPPGNFQSAITLGPVGLLIGVAGIAVIVLLISRYRRG
jgi:hypothetical protein